MKKRLEILAICLMLLFVVISYKVSAKEFEHMKDIAPDKNIVIDFNQPIDASSINERNIFILNSKCRLFNGLSFKISDDKKSVTVLHKTTFESDETYTLYIRDIKASNKTVLAEENSKKFTVKSDGNPKIIELNGEYSERENNAYINTAVLKDTEGGIFANDNKAYFYFLASLKNLKENKPLIIPKNVKYKFSFRLYKYSYDFRPKVDSDLLLVNTKLKDFPYEKIEITLDAEHPYFVKKIEMPREYPKDSSIYKNIIYSIQKECDYKENRSLKGTTQNVEYNMNYFIGCETKIKGGCEDINSIKNNEFFDWNKVLNEPEIKNDPEIIKSKLCYINKKENEKIKFPEILKDSYRKTYNILKITNEWIYYSRFNSVCDGIYRISRNFTNKECLVHDVVVKFVNDDYIYYIKIPGLDLLCDKTMNVQAGEMYSVDNEGVCKSEDMYRINTETNSNEVFIKGIMNCGISTLANDNKAFYYSPNSGGNELYKVDLKTKNSYKIADFKASQIFAYNGCLYIINFNDKCLYKISTEGKELTKLTEESVNTMFKSNNKLYYVTPNQLIDPSYFKYCKINFIELK